MACRKMTGRLSGATVTQVRSGVMLPGYDRAALTTRIVHLGLGAFVRAHLACYTEDVLDRAAPFWGITGVSLQRPDQRDRLAPQDGLYCTLQRDGDGVTARVVGCLHRVLVAPEDPGAVIRAMADEGTRIVSLTVTEKGYCHDPATGRLDLAHPDIVHDLAHPNAPRSAIGLLVAALRERRFAGAAPFTVLCCDNLPHNGRLLAGLARDYAAAAITDGLAAWIEAEVAFPSTMVDRIVPALTDVDIADAELALGLHDATPVSHEPFRQWVIEDRFGPGGRPPWERAGAQIVADVAPFEHMKLRLLNGAHSALAYLGYLAGHETIPEAVADSALRGYVQALWREIVPMVPAPTGVDLNDYTAALLARFGNSAIRHRTWQIAMDGSQKLPQRLLTTIRERLAAGLPIPCLALAVAAWIRYAGGVDEAGRPIDVRDPMAERVRAVLDAAGSPAERVKAVLGLHPIFGDLAGSVAFRMAVTTAYARLLERGARAAAALSG